MSKLLNYVTGFVLMASQANAIEMIEYKLNINKAQLLSLSNHSK